MTIPVWISRTYFFCMVFLTKEVGFFLVFAVDAILSSSTKSRGLQFQGTKVS